MIHLYTLCWNDEPMLGSFFRHYDEIVDRYVIYDDGSTDGSIELCRAHPKVELRHWNRAVPDSFVISEQVFHDTVWKESRGRADWVILADIDEHLHHPSGLGTYLHWCARAGVTAVPALGFEMVARCMPPAYEHLADRLTRGAPRPHLSKLAVFKPGEISHAHYDHGGHQATLEGKVVYPKTDEALMLHYKYIEPTYTLARHRALWQRLSAGDRAKNWGLQYNVGEDELLACFRALEDAAVDPLDISYIADRDYPAQRWWRDSWMVKQLKRRHRLHGAVTMLANRMGAAYS